MIDYVRKKQGGARGSEPCDIEEKDREADKLRCEHDGLQDEKKRAPHEAGRRGSA